VPDPRARPARPGLAGLLRCNRAFRALWTSRLLSFFGDSLGLIALLLYTAQRLHTGLAVALLMIAGDFVPSLISPLAGVLSDRRDRRAVMVGCELLQGALIAVIAVTLPGLPLLLTLVAVQACVAAVFQPASRAAVPGLVPGADLERANAAIGFGTNGMEGFAPLAAAALLAWISIRGLLLLDAATFVISAALLLTLPRLTAAGSRPQPGLVFAHARAGLSYLWGSTVLRIIAITFCAVVLFNGVDDVCLVFLARHALHGSNSAASLVYAGAGIGLLAGFALLARSGKRLGMTVLVLSGYAIASAGNLLTGVSFAIVAAFGFQIVRGLGLAAMDTGHSTLIQRMVPADMLGRVFANVYGAVGAAAGLSYLLGGLLLDAAGPRVTLVAAGTGGMLAAAAAALVLPRALSRAQPPAVSAPASRS
jgi:MFS family permease